MTKKKKKFNVDFLSYLSHLKNKLKIEKSICIKKKQKFKFNKFNIMKISKPVFHNLLYRIKMFMHCIYT